MKTVMNIYSVEDLLNSIRCGNSFSYIYFWGHTPYKENKIGKYVLSQWFEAGFYVNNIYYRTSEHFMMASKAALFEDKTAFEKIITCQTPKEAKEIGREVTGFNESVWKDKCFDIVVEGNLHKFKQNIDIYKYLMSTGDKILVEASHFDTIWGVGLSASDERIKNPEQWCGKNLLGFALMKARDIFIKEDNDFIKADD